MVLNLKIFIMKIIKHIRDIIDHGEWFINKRGVFSVGVQRICYDGYHIIINLGFFMISAHY